MIRVPAKFFEDHEDRCCEPECTPVRRTSRFVWLAPDDPGLDELLDDAKHYADPACFDSDDLPPGLRRSAASTVKAITQVNDKIELIKAAKLLARRDGLVSRKGGWLYRDGRPYCQGYFQFAIRCISRGRLIDVEYRGDGKRYVNIKETRK
jgi:hypothetical protein